jgi:transposase InsO family protein
MSIDFLFHLAVLFRSLGLVFISRSDLVLENIALRKQIEILKRRKPRPRIVDTDRIVFVWLTKIASALRNSIFIVKPETVIGWHRKGFRLYWSLICKRGQKKNPNQRRKEIRRLIKQLALDNPTWGAPRIHGELLKLGYKVSERTVSRFMPKRKHSAGHGGNWRTFLRNHRHAISAMDFFTVPTIFYKQLYGFFIIGHDRRKIIHFNVTFHPTGEWIASQLQTAFSSDHSYKYLIHDRSSVFSALVDQTIRSLCIDPIKISFESPWQNGTAERFVGSIRRDILDHVIIINKRHLYRLFQEYLDYYHDDRTHYHLDKDTPDGRSVDTRPDDSAKLLDLPRLGGLHHRYVWKKAA